MGAVDEFFGEPDGLGAPSETPGSATPPVSDGAPSVQPAGVPATPWWILPIVMVVALALGVTLALLI